MGFIMGFMELLLRYTMALGANLGKLAPWGGWIVVK